MPNWTQNHVTFEGSKEKIIELKELFASDEKVFDFNEVVPMPEDSEDFQATGSFSMSAEKEDLSVESLEEKIDNPCNWYYWSIKNWGTKWNAVDGNLEVDDINKLEYSFRTAWDAPRGVMKAIVENRDTYIKGCDYVKWSCFHEFEEEEDVILEYKKHDK